MSHTISLIDLGSAYGISKSGIGVMHLGVMNSKLIMRGIIPPIMAGILGIYGLIVACIIGTTIRVADGYSSFKGHAHLAAGLAVGLSALAAGMSLGVVGDAGVRAFGRQQKVFVALLLIMIFAEALGLYGVIVSLVMTFQPGGPSNCKDFLP